MQLLPLNKLGPREVSPNVTQFGLYLPRGSTQNVNRLSAKVVREADRFIQDIPPLALEFAHSVDAQSSGYWSKQVATDEDERAGLAARGWGYRGRRGAATTAELMMFVRGGVNPS